MPVPQDVYPNIVIAPIELAERSLAVGGGSVGALEGAAPAELRLGSVKVDFWRCYVTLRGGSSVT